ncbi:hypothetical protein Chor_013147 [Crotalus horridus]
MDSQRSYDVLVKGLQSVDVTGDFTPCELLLTGDRAFPVLVDSKGQVLIAAAQYGKGRMVVTAHEVMIQLPQFLPFIKNALQWLRPSPMAPVGVHRSLDALSKLLLGSGIKVQPGATLGDSPGVFCRDAYDDVQADDLVQFVKRGGRLLIGGQAWHWSYQHGKEAVLVQFPGNLVTGVAGVYFTANVGENGVFSMPGKIPKIPLITEPGIDVQKDLVTLLKGVERFNVKGDDLQKQMTPSTLLIHGALAFPVGISDTHQSFLAAAYYGRGRIVVASHEGFLSMPSMKSFLLNAINWLSAGKRRQVGIGDNLNELYSMLNQAMIPCELTHFKEGLDIYCCTAYDAKDMESIHAFVSEGGGLLIGGQSWYWASVNPNSSAIAEYPGNKILNKFGIGIIDKSLEIPENSCPAREASEVASTYHFRQAFLQFKKHIQNEQILQPPYSLWLQRLAEDMELFLEIPATNSRLLSSVHEEALELVQIKGIPEVSVRNPIQSNSDQAILLQIASVLYKVLPEFQGLVPSLKPYEPSSYPTAPPQKIQINGSNTGDFPQVQIGCHTDSLVNLKEWMRPPVVTRQFLVKTAKMEISSLWGGLLYIIVPDNCSLGYFSVTIEGATQAPYFKHGETSIQDWQDTIRHYPAPWAELETENIILTLPSDSIRSHDGVDFLLQTWDEMMRAITHLAAIPPIFPRPERIVADVQLSAGKYKLVHVTHSKYQTMSNIPDDNRYKMNLWAETFSQEVNRNLGPFFKTWGWPIEGSVSEKLAMSYPAWAEDPMIQYRRS